MRIDPSKVKAGDMVTLERANGALRLKAEVNSQIDITVAGKRMFLNDFYRDGWELTDHQPAPEPEWKPGVVAKATVRGVPNVLVVRAEADALVEWISVPPVEGPADPHPERYHADYLVNDVRPLAVIDPAAVDVDALKRVLASADYDYQAQADAALKFLGIKE